VYVSEER